MKHQQLPNAVMLPRDRIRPNPAQPRKQIDPEALAGLRESIREHGVIQPIVVRHEPSRYDATPFIIVAGERRWQASEGVLDRLPCIISDVDTGTAQQLALVENIQRSDLLEIEEARGLVAMMDAKRLSTRTAARALGVSPSWIQNRLALLKTKPDVQEVADKVPLALSSLLLIDTVTKDPDLRAELLAQVLDNVPFKVIQKQVQQYRDDLAWEKESSRAPDHETEERQTAYEETGGGQLSRGRMLTTGTKASEALQETLQGLKRAEAGLMHARSWMDHVPAKKRTDFTDLLSHCQSLIDAIKKKGA